MSKEKDPVIVDDNHESIGTLFKLRTPSLLLGLVLGIGISFVTSNFEEVLAKNVHVAFFLPFIVYIADAVGTQTEAIYSRALKHGKDKYFKYFWKELLLGIVYWIVFWVLSGIIAFMWLHDLPTAQTVALASLVAIAVAPIVSLTIAQIFRREHQDPAAGTGPVATVIQDLISVVIYGAVASMIVL